MNFKNKLEIVIFQIDMTASYAIYGTILFIYDIILCFHLTYLVLTTWPI